MRLLISPTLPKLITGGHKPGIMHITRTQCFSEIHNIKYAAQMNHQPNVVHSVGWPILLTGPQSIFQNEWIMNYRLEILLKLPSMTTSDHQCNVYEESLIYMPKLCRSEEQKWNVMFLLLFYNLDQIRRKLWDTYFVLDSFVVYGESVCMPFLL